MATRRKPAAAPLVRTIGKRNFTSSRTIAEAFGKRHADVLRTIANHLAIPGNDAFNERNFAPRDFIDSRGKTQPEYLLTEEGFAVIALAFTGEKATAMRIRFVEAFASMNRRLLQLERQTPEYVEARNEASIGQQMLATALVESRAAIGKLTKPHHFANEAKLLTFALTGKSEPVVDRSRLTPAELRLLAKIEHLDFTLMLRGIPYGERRAQCRQFALKNPALTLVPQPQAIVGTA